MKKIISLLIILVFAIPTFSHNILPIDENKIEIYYFHNTRRCETCQAVEDVTKEALEEYFAVQLEQEVIVFKSLNLEVEAELAEKLGVSGQTLLVVKGEEQENLTNTAFLHARNNPDKLKKKVKKAIDKLIKSEK